MISDSGEGAQRCGQSLGAIAARMGNGIWTVEIIPAEIQPPARSVAGASGNRIRIGSARVTNGGDETDLVVAFNEQVLLGRVRAGELQAGLHHPAREHVARARRSEDRIGLRRDTRPSWWHRRLSRHRSAAGARVPRGRPDTERGKNMFVLGMLCSILQPRPAARARADRAHVRQEGRKRHRPATSSCSRPGYAWAEQNLDFKYSHPGRRARPSRRSSSTAIPRSRSACSPPAWRSARCIRSRRRPRRRTTLSDVFEKVGGVVHQAEDEIAACAFAIGASYAGKCTVTITSGPGYSLKQEAIGLAVMGEIPLVVVNVQRGGPSTGQPTKVEQGDLLAAMFGSHGDAPKVVMAACDDRGLLLFDHHGAQDRRDLQHGRGRAVRREPGHVAAAVPAPAVQRGVACAAGRSERGARGHEALRLECRQPGLRGASFPVSAAACTR